MTETKEAPQEDRDAAPWARSLASGSANLFVATLVGNSGFFVALLILTRALSLSERGTVAFLTVTALFTAHIVGFGLGDATTVFVSSKPSMRPRLLTNLLVASALISITAAAVVCVVVALLAHHGPPGVGTAELLLLAAGIVVSTLYYAAYAHLLGYRQFRSLAFIQGGWSWIYAGVLVVISFGAGLDVLDVMVAWVLCFGTGTLALIVLSVRQAHLGKPDARLFLEALQFGLRAWVVSASRFVNFRSDQILMAFLSTEAALGTYAVAVNASEILLYLPYVTAFAIVPVISGSHESTRSDRTLRVFRVMLPITGAAVVLAAVIGPELIPLVFGDVYQGSVTPFLWLLPGALGFAAISVFPSALIGASRPGRASIGPLVAVVVGLCLDILLIPRFEATGAAAAASVALIAGGCTALVVFQRHAQQPWRAYAPGRRDLQSVLTLARAGVRRPARGTGSS